MARNRSRTIEVDEKKYNWKITANDDGDGNNYLHVSTNDRVLIHKQVVNDKIGPSLVRQEILELRHKELKDWLGRIKCDLMADDYHQALHNCTGEALVFFVRNKELDTPENRKYFGLR